MCGSKRLPLTGRSAARGTPSTVTPNPEACQRCHWPPGLVRYVTVGAPGRDQIGGRSRSPLAHQALTHERVLPLVFVSPTSICERNTAVNPLQGLSPLRGAASPGLVRNWDAVAVPGGGPNAHRGPPIVSFAPPSTIPVPRCRPHRSRPPHVRHGSWTRPPASEPEHTDTRRVPL